MNASILVAYATRYGSTQEVAEAIAATLRDARLEVTVQPMREVHRIDEYDAVVLGAALYMHRWHTDARRFLLQHRAALTQRPVAVFVLGPVRQPHDAQEFGDARAQLDQELAKFPWLTPVALELFGGTFDPAKLRFPLNVLAGKAPASDARDWVAIRAWASDLVARLPSTAHQQEV
jgi:menaquinone-dependent protoporphyrinogen oxidase